MSRGPGGPDSRRWLALALLGAAFFMVILDGTIVYVALPSIDEALGIAMLGALLALLLFRAQRVAEGARPRLPTRVTPCPSARASGIPAFEVERGSCDVTTV